MTGTRFLALGQLLLICASAASIIPSARAAAAPSPAMVTSTAVDTLPVDFSGVSLSAISGPTGQTFSYTPVAGGAGTVNVRLLRGAVMSAQTGNQPDLTGLYVLAGAPDSITLRLTFDRPVLFDVVDNETMTLQEIGILAKSLAGGSWTVLSQENCAVASSDTMVSFQGLSDSAPFGHYYCRASSDRFDWTIINVPGFYSVLGSAISLRVLGDAPATAVAPPTPVPGGLLMTLWPNPAAQEFNIRFSSPVRTQGSLDVFDATGRRVRALYSGEIGPEARAARWDAESENGLKVAAGLYWVRLTTGDRSRWIAAIVVR